MITARSDVYPRFEVLLNTEIDSYEWLVERIKQLDEVDASLSYEYAWRYIRQTTNTADQEAKQAYLDFTQTIYPEWITISDRLGRKLIASPFCDQLPAAYHNYIRSVKHAIDLFREENVPLMSKEKALAAQFSEIIGALSIDYNGETLTMKQAEDYLKSSDRTVRKEVFELIEARRYQDHERLDALMTDLIAVRTQIAQQCWFATYTDYSFSFRYDYTRDHVNQFHQAIETVMSPIIEWFFAQRTSVLCIEELQPYDFDCPLVADVESQLFASTDEMIDKLCLLLRKMDPAFEDCIRTMQSKEYLDLETRHNKAPWWYNYPLVKTPYSFIFMNAMRDHWWWFTWAHEAGHAIHHYCTHHLWREMFRNCPSEICEIASMAMELFVSDDLARIGCSPTQITDALQAKTFFDLGFLPYMSKIDIFQQRLYDNPTHSVTERHEQWRKLNERYPASMRTHSTASWSWWYQHYLDTFRQRQMHIFQHPFYYIEYGIAYLASVQLYQQFLDDRLWAIKNYKNILSAWYTHSIPETMALWSVQFVLDAETLESLMKTMLDRYDMLDMKK